MKTVDVDMLRKRYLFHAEIEIDSLISELKKYDYSEENVFTKDEVIAMLKDLDLQIDESAAYNLEVAKVQRLIRDRIDKLKEHKDGANKKTSD